MMLYFNDCYNEQGFTTEEAMNFSNLDDFLTTIDKDYQERVRVLDLFNTDITSRWTYEQKVLFVKLFYHARGHFYKFLWYIGSLCQDIDLKESIFYNVNEELGGKGKSHEQMYLDFADSLGVDLLDEIYSEQFYTKFLRDFNKNHLKWILEKEDAARLCLFSAYERLDNIDYTNLLELVKSIGITEEKGLLFFIVHSHAEHFNRLRNYLNNIWNREKETVISAFNFTYENQLIMWRQLSILIKHEQHEVCQT
jgi:pyrroloquinoline quinone (PQQ) biosynthesis protein C